MREPYIIFLVVFATCLTGGLSDEATSEKEQRLISTFQIVRFPNDACVGTNSRNGTCFTSAECSDKDGSSSGSCADGFGVCCTFVISTCDQSSSQNITYWDMTPTTVSTTVPSSCTLTITPVNDNICQLRIDFTAFVITGPSTTSIFEAHHQLGQIPRYDFGAPAGGILALTPTTTTWGTNCLVDRFSISGVSSSNQPPTICGTNTGYHMYVDAHENSNSLSFQFSAAAGPAAVLGDPDTRGISTLATRNWDMTVLQYECGHINAAPPGCTQYMWGPLTGKVTSYNYAGAVHLANQNQKICIRRERAYCYACFARDANAISFQYAGENGSIFAFQSPGQPCGYHCEGNNGLSAAGNQCGSYDCVIIPGAFIVAIQTTGIITVAQTTAANIRTLATATYQTPAPPQISSLGAFSVGLTDSNLAFDTIIGDNTLATICTKHVPFMFHFKSDDHEGNGIAAEYGSTAAVQANTGINIDYELISCT